MTACDHAPGHRLQREQRACDIDRKQPIIALAGDLDDRRGVEQRGVVDQDIDPAERPFRVADSRVDRVLTRYVELDGQRTVADRRGCFPRGGNVDIGQRDARALSSVALGKRQPDPTRRAGDDRCLPREPHHEIARPSLSNL